MDRLDILELPNVKVVSVETSTDEIVIEVECVNGTAKCSFCGYECNIIHSVKVKKVKDLPILKKKCFIKFHHRRFYCPRCDKTFMERSSWVDQYERYTSRYADWIAEAGKEIDVKKAACLLGVGYKVVLKNNEDLSCKEQTLLKKAFSCSEKLHKVYLRKEEFRRIFEKNTSRKKAERQLNEWIQKAVKIRYRQMTTFLKTVEKRKNYILNYFNHFKA